MQQISFDPAFRDAGPMGVPHRFFTAAVALVRGDCTVFALMFFYKSRHAAAAVRAFHKLADEIRLFCGRIGF